MKICPLCRSEVKSYSINFHEDVCLCSNEDCTYPFGNEDIEIISKKSDETPFIEGLEMDLSQSSIQSSESSRDKQKSEGFRFNIPSNGATSIMDIFEKETSNVNRRYQNNSDNGNFMPMKSPLHKGIEYLQMLLDSKSQSSQNVESVFQTALDGTNEEKSEELIEKKVKEILGTSGQNDSAVQDGSKLTFYKRLGGSKIRKNVKLLNSLPRMTMLSPRHISCITIPARFEGESEESLSSVDHQNAKRS